MGNMCHFRWKDTSTTRENWQLGRYQTSDTKSLTAVWSKNMRKSHQQFKGDISSPYTSTHTFTEESSPAQHLALRCW